MPKRKVTRPFSFSTAPRMFWCTSSHVRARGGNCIGRSSHWAAMTACTLSRATSRSTPSATLITTWLARPAMATSSPPRPVLGSKSVKPVRGSMFSIVCNVVKGSTTALASMSYSPLFTSLVISTSLRTGSSVPTVPDSVSGMTVIGSVSPARERSSS